MEYYLAIKKKEILPFAATGISLESTMLRVYVRQRKTNTVCYHLYVESKRIKQMNIQNRNRFAHIDYKLVFTSRHKEGGSSKIGIVD